MRGSRHPGSIFETAGSPERTATAHVVIDERGNATYDFDIDWTLPPRFEIPVARIFHTGSVAATLAPGADEVRAAPSVLAKRGWSATTRTSAPLSPVVSTTPAPASRRSSS